MGLLVISELDLGYHRLRAQDSRAYWRLRLSGALHLDSPADGHPAEGSETPHRLQARVSIGSAPSKRGQHRVMLIFKMLLRGLWPHLWLCDSFSVLTCQDLSCPERVSGADHFPLAG